MYSNVDHLRRKTLQLCSSMAARFQEIEGADYPLTSPKDLIEGLAKILSEIEGKIRSVDSYQELVEYSGRSRHPIPVERDTPFRLKSTPDSGERDTPYEGFKM